MWNYDRSFLLYRFLLTMRCQVLAVLVLVSVAGAMYFDDVPDYSMTRSYTRSACMQCLFTHKREYCEICKYENDGGANTSKRSYYYQRRVRGRNYYCLCCARSRLTNSGCCNLCSNDMWVYITEISCFATFKVGCFFSIIVRTKHPFLPASSGPYMWCHY